MAVAFKPTPTLEGRDAVRFLRQVKENENKSASKEEIRRAIRFLYKITHNNHNGSTISK